MKDVLKLIPVLLLACMVSVPALASDELLPPQAKPGECYARVFVPPAYQTASQTVLQRAEYERLEVVPAQYEWATERVLVKEASERLEVVPATYEWVTERVLVKPETQEIQVTPAQWETVTEQVLDRPGHTVWKKGSGPIQKIDNATGEIMCLVEVPATYKTVTKRVLKSPATTREVAIPAEYETVRKQVQKTPPSTRKVEIPAEYKTVRVRRLASPPQVRKTSVPAEYQTVTSTKMVAEGRMAWQPILCETNLSQGVARDIQIALRDAGHYNGPIDGIIGAGTLSAMRSYQRANNLPEGHMTLETLQKLGVNVRR